ncbi:MAG: hypothetical protein GVX78_04625 [Bacteroidetes bacterium]|jgi:hypothetical protein|nr:hypothetical protein [Bacteroidota bacterium]
MGKYRIFYTALLMLAYFFGLAHDMIPHAHETSLSPFDEDPSILEVGQKPDHGKCSPWTTLSHTDRKKGDLFHLLSCLLSQVEHPDGNCDQELCSKTQGDDKRSPRSFTDAIGYVQPGHVLFSVSTPSDGFFIGDFLPCISYVASVFDRGPPCP